MGRYIRGVHAHSKLAALEEMIGRNIRDGDVRRGVLHALGILLGPEDVDLTVWCAESLETFVALLAVVQSWGHAVDAEKRVLDEDGGRPFACLDGVVRFDVAGNCVGR
jgi:hypothetical protein